MVTSAPGSPVTMGKELIVMELPRLELESYEDTELNNSTDVASSPLYSTLGRVEEYGLEEDG